MSKPIYDALKAMILNQELKPGEKLVQEKIAAMLGVSRTPLMKALQMLEHELLVESIPRRGMFVKKVSVKEMIDTYYCRESIECMAVRLATIRSTDKELKELAALFDPFVDKVEMIDSEAYTFADEKFHDSVIELSQNPILGKMSKLSHIHSQVYSIGLLRTPVETMDEHLLIINAMLARDAGTAEFEMQKHIQRSREILERRSHSE